MGKDTHRETTQDCSVAQRSEIHPRGGGCGFWFWAMCALSIQIQVSCMRKLTSYLTSALMTGLQNKYPFLLSLRTSGVYLWLCLTYSGGQVSKRSVNTYGGGQKELEIALYESTLALELMSSGQLISEKSCKMALEIDGKGAEA